MRHLKILRSVECDHKEELQLLEFVMALRKQQVADFLGQYALRKGGTKEQLRERLRTALATGHLPSTHLVRYLDEVVPWGKQHVYLYDGPTSGLRKWRSPKLLRRHLERHKASRYLNSLLPVVLPDRLKLSSIQHDESGLRVVAVQKKVYRERLAGEDQEREDDDGNLIELKAFKRYTTRGLVVFEWNLTANIGMLQITQLPSEGDYRRTAEEFAELVEHWLPIGSFSRIAVSRAIKTLHKAEDDGKGETRSSSIGFRTIEGRYFAGKSASSRDALLGERATDEALRSIGQNSVGHDGNFYWLPGIRPGGYANPIGKEVHVYILGDDKQRVRFPTPNNEKVVRYVLQRVRTRCQ